MAENPWQRQIDWAFFVAQDHRLAESQFRQDALAAARTIMQRARRNVEMLVDRLITRGYEFVEPERVHIAPASDVADWASEFQRSGIHLPIAFQAWLLEVGTVNLMGTDPNWPSSGYSGRGYGDVWYTDPLVVDVDQDYIDSEFVDWKSQAEDEGFAAVGPFYIPFAPDEIHKANFSGGAPYGLIADHPTVDPLVFNERHCFSFVAHVRHAFSWGGFPGFEIISTPPNEFLAEMQAGLEPI